MKSESVFQGLDRAFWCKFCAAGAGSVLEWYDFAAFGSLADVIGDVLLPPSHSALVDALAVFGAAFLMRPLGAIFIGAIADAYSRKLALEISILLMVLPTLCIAALPSYAFAGNSSTALLVLLRLAQGFFVGAELTTAFVFVYENAPQPRNASVLAALQYNFVSVGSLAGLGVAVGLRASLSPEALRSWGWRVALAAGAPLGAAGLWLRFRLEDASDNTRKGTKTPLTWAALRAPMAAALRYGNRRRMACFSVVAAAKLMPYYVIFVWLPLGFRQLGVPSAYSLAAVGTAFFCVAAICLAPLVRAPPPKDGESPWADDDDEEEDECAGVEESALLSLGKAAPPADSRRGRLEMSANARYWYKVGAGLLIVVSPAFFVALAAYPSTPLAIAMLGVIAFGCALIAVGIPAIAVAVFPPGLRGVGCSFSYNVASAVFGGLAPVYASLLFRVEPWLVGALLATILAAALVCLADLERALARNTPGGPCCIALTPWAGDRRGYEDLDRRRGASKPSAARQAFL